MANFTFEAGAAFKPQSGCSGIQEPAAIHEMEGKFAREAEQDGGALLASSDVMSVMCSPAALKFVFAAGVGLMVITGPLTVQAQGKESEFDRSAAASALGSVNLAGCKKPKGPTGDGHVIVTFAPAGRASDVVVDQGPFAGTKVGKCIATEYRKVKIPKFSGNAVSVGKKFKIE